MSAPSAGTERSPSTKRRLLTLASLLLCLTILALWPRSYWRSDALRLWLPCPYRASYHYFLLYSGRGGLLLTYGHSRYVAPVPYLPSRFLYSAEEDPEAADDGNWPHTVSSVSVAHFGYYYSRYQSPPPSPPRPTIYVPNTGPIPPKLISETGLALFVPHWFLILLTSLPPLLYLRASHRIRPGLCPTCGYDLRATPDRCPECGAPATVPPPLPSPNAVSP